MNTIIKINLIAQVVLLWYFLLKEYIEKMITINGLRLLLKIRKVQQYEDGNVRINLETGIITTDVWNNGILEETRPKVILQFENKEKLKKTLKQLEKYEWISFVQDLDGEKIYRK